MGIRARNQIAGAEAITARRSALAAFGVACGQLLVGNKPARSNEESRAPKDPWRIFSWECGIAEPGSIQRIVFNVRAPQKGNPFSFPVSTTIEVDDTSALLRASEAARHALTRAVSRDTRGGFGGDASVASVKFVKEDAAVTVYLTMAGFALDVTAALPEVFYSWLLAKVLDDVYFIHSGHHLPPRLFSVLSGEAQIEAQKNAYYKSFAKVSEGSKNNE